VGLIGRDFLWKLRAQITFDSDGRAALKLRGPEVKTLNLTVAQKEEWQLYANEGRPLSFPSRFQVYGLKITLPGLAQNVPPVVVELKPGVTLSARSSTSFPARSRLEFKKSLTDS
jgi:hypothetical protein